MRTTAIDYLSQYRRLLSSAGKKDLNWLVGTSVLAGIAEGLSLLVLLVAATSLVSGTANYGLSAGGWIWVLLALGAAGFAIGYYQARRSYRSAMDLMRNCHIVVGDKIASLPLGWFGRDKAGEYSRAMTGGMMQMGQALAHMMSTLLARIALIVVILIGLWIWQPTLGLVLTVSLPIQAVVVWGAGRISHKLKSKYEPTKHELSSRIVEYASCQGALRSAGRATHPPYLKNALQAEARASMISLFANSGLLVIASGVAQGIVVVLIYFAAQLALGNTLSAMATVAFIGVMLRLNHSVSEIGEMTVALQEQSPILASIAEVLDRPIMPTPEETRNKSLDSSVQLDKVNFEYEPHTPVLRDVSFTIPARTMTAVVGPSGSGKTTIARLVSRFYDVQSGGISIGGTDVRDYTTADLMAKLSMVFQDVYLFNDTLEANIRVGRQDATHEEVRQAAEVAGVSEIIERLPQGWNTMVGEGGGRLSGGERQRVSIARALLKRAPVVLVDEATSALDAENEINIQHALEQLRANATVLVIAHKLDTIRNADQIVVLAEDGKIAQIGTHDELVEQQGAYQRFWRQRETAAGWHLV